MASRDRVPRDCELLIPVADFGDEDASSKPSSSSSSSSSSSHHTGRENMLQDNLRSAVHGSFVTCDDPKGIVGCGMTRKSKWFPENRAENGKSKNSRRML
ncbi:hypothetical protein C1H46_023928 [Malus baccata]|uniref:Uncharacterized protein n=1 Tax=Malus baccata TaxID=106549 RepID=A0A540LVG4_MALBA|nr:hypothetical protein C1H46_023928 [Malus baccata]